MRLPEGWVSLANLLIGGLLGNTFMILGLVFRINVWHYWVWVSLYWLCACYGYWGFQRVKAGNWRHKWGFW